MENLEPEFKGDILHKREMQRHGVTVKTGSCWDFPVVKNLHCNAGDKGLIPGWRTKIPHVATITEV